MKIRLTLMICALASVLALGSAPIASGAPTSTTCAVQGVDVRSLSVDQARQLCVNQGGATQRSTPDGFKLYNPGTKTTFVYKSDYYNFAILQFQGTSFRVLAELKVQFQQSVPGGSSKLWTLAADADLTQNEGGLTYAMSFSYVCGVNLPGDDPRCNEYKADGSDPDRAASVYNDGDVYDFFFGSTANVTKFPMFQFSVQWSNGDFQTFKFRGYDVCVRAFTTGFCRESGTGN